ncbi:ATP-binding protein [Streptomyces netropsis]
MPARRTGRCNGIPRDRGRGFSCSSAKPRPRLRGRSSPVLVIDSHEATVAKARRAAADYVRRLCPWADCDAVTLVISELVGNAVRHTTQGYWRLCLSRDAGLLIADVQDTSCARPAPRRPDLAEGGGMGWHIVAELTSKLTVHPGPDGKTVRAEWRAREGSGTN